MKLTQKKSVMKYALGITSALFLASQASAVSYEIYGGTTSGPDLNYGPVSGNEQAVDTGIAYGFGIYQAIPGGFSLGVDAMSTSQDYDSTIVQTSAGDKLSSTSLMVNGRYRPNINWNGFQLYLGAGLGGINVEYESPTSSFLDGNEWISGFQVEWGVEYSLIPNLTAFGGIKYQAGFDQAYIQNEYVEFNRLVLMGGVRF